MFPYCGFRDMIKTSFSAAQACSYCSLIQTSYRRKPPHSPMKTAAWERPDASPWQECDKPLHRLCWRPSWSFPWAKHWRARAVLLCNALRQAGKERHAFLLIRRVLLPGTIFTPFSFSLFSSSQNSHRHHLHNFPAYQLDILIAETAPTGKSC